MAAKGKQESLPGVTAHDPATYRAMSIPFDSMDEANRAHEAFYAAVAAARELHGIRDVHLITEVDAATEDGEMVAMTSAHFGSRDREESMVAWELGRVQTRRQQRTGALLTGPFVDRSGKRGTK